MGRVLGEGDRGPDAERFSGSPCCAPRPTERALVSTGFCVPPHAEALCRECERVRPWAETVCKTSCLRRAVPCPCTEREVREDVYIATATNLCFRFATVPRCAKLRWRFRGFSFI